MFFAILKKRSDGLDCFLNFFIVGNRSFFLCQTHVTLSTIMAALFTKILKEHTTATSVGGSDIVGNLVDALLKVRLTVFIHHRRKGDEFGVNTGYSVTHRRCLTMRNEIYDAVVVLLYPIIPHACFRLYEILGHEGSIDEASWPKVCEDALVEDEKLIVVQVNGKVRSRLTVAADASEDDIKAKALADEAVTKFTDGKEIRKVIYIKGKLLNIVAA